jgi:hypothetical protein
MAPPASGAHSSCLACHTLDTPLAYTHHTSYTILHIYEHELSPQLLKANLDLAQLPRYFMSYENVIVTKVLF